MKKCNKKLLIFIIIFLIIDILLITFVKENFLNNGIKFKSAEEKYIQTLSKEDLILLANALLQTERYEDIVEYYPTLLSIIPNMADLVIESDVWKEDRGTLDKDDIINIYIFTYLDAVFETEGISVFKDEFKKYSTLIKMVEKNNEIETLGFLQLYFFNTLGRYSSGFDKNETSAFLHQFIGLWNECPHLEHYNNCFYLFCSKWYSNIADIDNYNKVHKKITKPYIALLENEKKLPNNYVIGYSNEYESYIMGIKGYGVSVFVEITENICAYAKKGNIVVVRCVDKELEKYFIVNTTENTTSVALDKKAYKKQAKELSLDDIQFKLLTNL